jgi:enoyl-CoA hydratase
VSDALLVDVRDGVIVMTINRPEVRNAINADVARGIAAGLDLLDAESELRIGVLTGAGGTFSSGMDLKGFLTGETPTLPGRGFGGLAEALPRKPLIAAVEGWALAGGFELALACDLIVAAKTARFGIPEVKRGLVAAAGGLLRLPKALPFHLAMQLTLTGDPISAERAHEAGLVSLVTEEAGALEGALQLAERIAANGPLAVTASKEILRRQADWTDLRRGVSRAPLWLQCSPPRTHRRVPGLSPRSAARSGRASDAAPVTFRLVGQTRCDQEKSVRLLGLSPKTALATLGVGGPACGKESVQSRAGERQSWPPS